MIVFAINILVLAWDFSRTSFIVTILVGTVVSLVGTNTSNAQAAWRTAGFTGTVIFAPAPPPQYKIGWQSLAAGTDVACTSNITVQPTAP